MAYPAVGMDWPFERM